MNKRVSISRVTGVVVDEQMQFSLDDFCTACKTDHTTILKLIDEGVLNVSSSRETIEFSGNMLPRAVRAVRLKRDLQLNTAGVAITLELLAEIDSLRKQLARLSPDDVSSTD